MVLLLLLLLYTTTTITITIQGIYVVWVGKYVYMYINVITWVHNMTQDPLCYFGCMLTLAACTGTLG